MNIFFKSFLFAAQFAVLLPLRADSDDLHAITFIPDPPPAIDGTLKRFESTPGWFALEKKESVVYGQAEWRGTGDLSAKVIAAWDPQNLYIAARVKDRGMQQPYRSSELWKGSHVMVMLDLPRQEAGERSAEKIIQIGLSPGDPKSAAPQAELYQWQPREGDVTGGRVASQLTKDAYQIEAAIPWTSLGIAPPQEGTLVGIDITVNSSDRPGEVMQNKLMSLLTTPWKLRDPDRLLEAALADSDGVINTALLPKPATPLGGEREVPAGQSETTNLTTPEGMQAVQELVLNARIDYPQLAGGTHTMRVSLNGEELDHRRIRNRMASMEIGVLDVSTHSRNRWFLLYSADFTPPGRETTYFVRNAQPFEFRFDVRDLWKQGATNELTVEHLEETTAPLHFTVAASASLSPKQAEPEMRPPPVGKIPTHEPAWRLPEKSVKGELLDDGSIRVELAGKKWQVESAFALPQGRWASLGGENGRGWRGIDQRGSMAFSAHTEGYQLKRRIEVRGDHVAVFDELSNRSEEDQPVLLRHYVNLPASERSAVYLCGRSFSASEMATEEGENPTSLALTEEGGIGLVSEDDIMRVQSDNFYNDEQVGIRNNRFVLAKGRTITLEFSIYPLEKPDRYLMINRIRNNWGVNRTIPGAFAFIGATREDRGFRELDDAGVADYLRFKGVTIGSIYIPYHDGIATHGGRFKEYNWQAQADYVQFLKKLQPGIKVIPYFHCFISNGKGDTETYKKAAIVSADGKQLHYGNLAAYPLFAPVEGDAFAALQEELLEARFDLGVDGIYWDEYEFSQAKYQFSPEWWDGVTGDIDLTTHALLRRISNITLLTQPWRKKIATAILQRGILFGNAQPLTRTFTQLDFHRCIETASINNLVKGQLGTPLALGDHLTEQNERDAYRNMVKALDFSALYAWYDTSIRPTEPTLAAFMFPSTPIELGKGFMIAKERIVTNTSGFFGWRDESDFEAVVFDRSGRRTDEVSIPRVVRDGRAYAEVRIPEGYAVALLRKEGE